MLNQRACRVTSDGPPATKHNNVIIGDLSASHHYASLNMQVRSKRQAPYPV
jgi:hypothetical protein